MSLSEPKLTNPVTKFITFKSEKNKFVYWDKEQEKNIEVQMPIYFIVLDELTTIRGYHPVSGSGIYSNEIKYLGDEILNVKSFKGNLYNIVGKYSDIKDSIKANGGKYAKSIYAALITGKNSIEMVNFNFSGSSVSEWIEKKINTEQFGIRINETTQQQGKKDVYYVPVFNKLNFPEGELMQKAIEMDKKLQEYLRAYRNIKEDELNQNTSDLESENEHSEQDRMTTQDYTETFYPDMVSEDSRKIKEQEENLNVTDDLPF